MKLTIRSASVRWVAGATGAGRVVSNAGPRRKRAPHASATPPRGNARTHAAELIAAAHAHSFSLALVRELGRAAISRGDIVTSAAVTLERVADGWTITNLHLDVAARLPKVKQGQFIDATLRAKTGCLVSRALRPTISMNAKLKH